MNNARPITGKDKIVTEVHFRKIRDNVKNISNSFKDKLKNINITTLCGLSKNNANISIFIFRTRKNLNLNILLIFLVHHLQTKAILCKRKLVVTRLRVILHRNWNNINKSKKLLLTKVIRITTNYFRRIF